MDIKKLRLAAAVSGIFILIAFIAAAFYVKKHTDSGELSKALEGEGSADSPYMIKSLEDYLVLTRGMQQEDNPFYEACFSLQCDLDLSGVSEQCVVGGLGSIEPFAGRFEGNGHCIRGIVYENPEGDAGLFPELRGIVRNLSLEDCSFSGMNAGSIAGQVTQKGRIYNCYASCSISGENPGGICSRMVGLAENCYYAGSLSVNALKTGSGEMLNCYSAGDGRSSEELCSLLNGNFSKMQPEGSLSKWQVKAGDLFLSQDMVQVPLSLSVLSQKGDKRQFGALFSSVKRAFCLTLPQALWQEEYEAFISYSDGSKRELVLSSEADSFSDGEGEIALEFYFTDDLPSLYFDAYDGDTLDYVNLSADNTMSGSLQEYDKEGRAKTDQKRVVFSGHGHDSFLVDKKSYSLKLDREVSIAGLQAAREYNLLSGYRNDCLYSYIYTRRLYQAMDIPYAHEYALINLYVDGQYRGLYFLTEKIAISSTAFDLKDMREETKELNSRQLSEYPFITEEGSGANARLAYYDIPHTPEDLSGGYILELDNTTIPLEKARFITEKGNIMSSKGDAYLSRKQLLYIRDLWQAFEEGLYSADGRNSEGVDFMDYIDSESFAMQWLLYDLTLEKSTMDSVYFYKDSDDRGDGLLHAVFDWDVEHAFTSEGSADDIWLVKEEGGERIWDKLYMHPEFRRELLRVWKERLRPAVLSSLDDREDISISFEANDFCWSKKGYAAKEEAVKAILRRRIEAMDRYLQAAAEAQD